MHLGCTWASLVLLSEESPDGADAAGPLAEEPPDVGQIVEVAPPVEEERPERHEPKMDGSLSYDQ